MSSDKIRQAERAWRNWSNRQPTESAEEHELIRTLYALDRLAEAEKAEPSPWSAGDAMALPDEGRVREIVREEIDRRIGQAWDGQALSAMLRSADRVELRVQALEHIIARQEQPMPMEAGVKVGNKTIFEGCPVTGCYMDGPHTHHTISTATTAPRAAGLEGRSSQGSKPGDGPVPISTGNTQAFQEPSTASPSGSSPTPTAEERWYTRLRNTGAYAESFLKEVSALALSMDEFVSEIRSAESAARRRALEEVLECEPYSYDPALDERQRCYNAALITWEGRIRALLPREGEAGKEGA